MTCAKKTQQARCPDLDDCVGNEPIPEDLCGEDALGIDLQCTVDEARREAYHMNCLRPYRVYLVWRKRRRDTDAKWDVVKRLELMPVEIPALDNTDLELASVGLDAVGPITLTEVSPRQVNEDDLRGKLDGRDLVGQEEEFFYEVVHRPFPGQRETPKRRYILASEPHHDAVNFQYVVNLKTSVRETGPDDKDENLPDEFPRVPMELIS